MSKRSMRRGLVPVAAILIAAAPFAARAQDRDLDRETSIGKVFTGDVPEGGGTARFLLTLAPGQAVDLTAAPIGGSDPKLSVFDARTGELVAENDDSGGGLASNVRLYSAAGQRVRIEVANAAVEDSNAAMRFDLILRPSTYRPKPPIPLSLGDAHNGALTPDDEQLFRFRGERGQLWDLSFSAAPGSSLDPALQVFAGEVAGGEALGQDDDGGGGLNARLRFLVPETGTYTVRAYGIGRTEGEFAFSAGRSEPAAVKDIGIGRPATGTLGAGSGDQLYRLSASARRAISSGSGPLVIELNRIGDAEEGSDNLLDPMLEVGFETPLGFSSLLSDDDGGGETSARVVFDASDLNGTWLEALRIKAMAFQQSTGHYELRVTTGGDD